MLKESGDKVLAECKLRNGVLSFFLLILCSCLMIEFAKAEAAGVNTKPKSSLIIEESSPEYLVQAILLFNEIYDINISEVHYRVSAELMMAWKGNTDQFLSEFGDKIIRGKKLNSFLNDTWHPEFIIANAENPRTIHYKTLDVIDGKFELFERFEADLSIDAIMPRYPFG